MDRVGAGQGRRHLMYTQGPVLVAIARNPLPHPYAPNPHQSEVSRKVSTARAKRAAMESKSKLFRRVRVNCFEE